MKRRAPLRSDPEKARQWRDRSRGRLKRKAPMAGVNRRRRRERFRRAYHSVAFVMFLRWNGCAVPGCELGEIHVHHLKSRGAGGTWEDTVPLCGFHHRLWHQVGPQAFCRLVRVTRKYLEDVRDRLVLEWKASTKGAES